MSKLPVCAVLGCPNTADPRWYAHTADGDIVMICDGHLGPCTGNPCTCPPVALKTFEGVTQWALRFFEEDYEIFDARSSLSMCFSKTLSKRNVLILSKVIFDEVFEFAASIRPKQLLIVSDFEAGSNWTQRALRTFDAVGFISNSAGWGANRVVYYQDNGGWNGCSSTSFSSAFEKYGAVADLR